MAQITYRYNNSEPEVENAIELNEQEATEGTERTSGGLALFPSPSLFYPWSQRLTINGRVRKPVFSRCNQWPYAKSHSTDKRSGITSDPNNPDDEEYIVRLVGQVVRVSVETVKIVNALPSEHTSEIG